MTKRAAIYIRQSQTSDDTISPALQEQHVRGFISREGWTATEVYADIDISGRAEANRPAFLKLKADYKAGKFDIAVADDFSRFSRNKADAMTLLGSMQIATYREGVPDANDDFMPAMYFLLADKFSKDMTKRWNAAHAYRLAEKLPPNGVRQYGYDRFTKDGKPVLPNTKGSVWEYRINEDEAAILRELYKRYTDGEGSLRLVQDLNARGVKTMRGGEWSSPQLFDLLDKPFAAGYFVWAGEQYVGKHEPILTAAEWTRYKAKRDERRVHQSPRNPKWWLSGIAKCDRCGSNLVSTTIRGKAIVGCSKYNNQGKAACAGVFRNRRTVEYHTEVWLFQHAEEWAAAMPTDDEARVATQKAVEDAEARVTEAQDALTGLLLTMRTHGLTEEMVADAMETLKANHAEAKEDLKDAQIALGEFVPANTIIDQLNKGFALMNLPKDGTGIPEHAIAEYRLTISKILKEVRVKAPEEGMSKKKRDMRSEIVFVPVSA